MSRRFNLSRKWTTDIRLQEQIYKYLLIEAMALTFRLLIVDQQSHSLLLTPGSANLQDTAPSQKQCDRDACVTAKYVHFFSCEPRPSDRSPREQGACTLASRRSSYPGGTAFYC